MRFKCIKQGIGNRICFILTIFLMFILCGCGIPVPYGWETDSQHVIGSRIDSEGKVTEQVVRYDKRLNFVFIGLPPEPQFFSYFRYHRYAIQANGSEREIWAMEHFPSLAQTNVNSAFPIPSGDRWITYEMNGITGNEGDEVDMTLILFSSQRGKILRHRFKHLIRYAPKKCHCFFNPWYIENNADFSILKVHETDKITRINTNTGEVIPETDDLPVFHAAE